MIVGAAQQAKSRIQASTAITIADSNLLAITVDASVAGATAAGLFRIPSLSTSYNIEWYEIEAETHNSGGAVAVTSASHEINFGTSIGSGRYVVTMDPVTSASNFVNFRFANGGDKLKINTVEQFGVAAFDNAQNMFNGCTNLSRINAPDLPDLLSVTLGSLASMFKDCPSLTYINRLEEWVTTGLLNFNSTFRSTQLDQNIGDWDISSVTDMTSIFLLVDLSTHIYGLILIGYAAQTVQSGIAFRVGTGTKYENTGTGLIADDPAAARAKLIATDSWTFIGDGEAA